MQQKRTITHRNTPVWTLPLDSVYLISPQHAGNASGVNESWGSAGTSSSNCCSYFHGERSLYLTSVVVVSWPHSAQRRRFRLPRLSSKFDDRAFPWHVLRHGGADGHQKTPYSVSPDLWNAPCILCNRHSRHRSVMTIMMSSCAITSTARRKLRYESCPNILLYSQSRTGGVSEAVPSEAVYPAPPTRACLNLCAIQIL